jgi:Protein of unknown function (DUF3616)
MGIRSLTLWTLLFTVASLVPSTVLGKPIDLDRYPVCEASAAIEVPCVDDPKASCIWVGDNEQEDNVFEYAVDANGKLTPTKHFEIKLGNAEVGDIEALVQDEQGLLVIGSHSRKSDCTKDSKHDRVAVARVLRDPLRAELVASGQGWEDRLTGCDSTWLKLEDAQPGSVTGLLRRDFCAAIAAAEKAADAVAGDKSQCAGEVMNVEGAVAVPDASGKPRIWLGLRAPLVGNRAVLLRVAPLGATKQHLTFDDIATIDLGGQGIRELTISEGWIWGIAGCVPDCSEPSHLWRVKVDALKSGAAITGVEFVQGGELPPSAEGLLIQSAAKRAIVLVDGDKGEVKGHCATAAQQLTVTLP